MQALATCLFLIVTETELSVESGVIWALARREEKKRKEINSTSYHKRKPDTPTPPHTLTPKGPGAEAHLEELNAGLRIYCLQSTLAGRET